MIRPLAYCESIQHFELSIDSIDNRIQELLELRKQYVAGCKALEEDKAAENRLSMQETGDALRIDIMNKIFLQQ
ncbi:hypothetical protein [Sphingobacterium paludis]|jgi:isochorismate pyruvate lyase|uniref:Uncharacterized protein n=1 Tax=Sphingobacterium paludis TaxID=1476465 RepID=A0A4R7D0V7_9SPHI|nr:hypothetical protein [Sphingobacterium paludis]TDS13947.1 hypothetical protein B0I21_104275 [Sphingobacterium paludis]